MALRSSVQIGLLSCFIFGCTQAQVLGKERAQVVAKFEPGAVVMMDLDGDGPEPPVHVMMPRMSVSVNAPIGESATTDTGWSLPSAIGWIVGPSLLLALGFLAWRWYMNTSALGSEDYEARN